MSFGTFARKVRDPDLPFPKRLGALGSCVQLYRPIGFHATFSFLQAQVGSFKRDEAALLRALELIETSRAVRQAATREFAARRRLEKQLGQRCPHPKDVNPYRLEVWFGAVRPAALHAVEYWNRRRLPALVAPSDPVSADVQDCATACLDAQGELTPEQRNLLARSVEKLERRLKAVVLHADPVTVGRTRDLLIVARFIETAAGATDA